MSEWKEYKLGELYDFSSGLSKAREFFGKGFGFVSFKDVFYNYFIPDQLTEMVLSTPKEQISCSVKKGDVFLTRTSETMEDLGMSTVALKNYPSATFNGFTKRLRPKDPYLISPTFAGYYFRSPLFRAKVTSYAIMTTRASLNNEILSRLTISLPPIEIQDSIGEVLKSLDDKIELNNKINQELEFLAQTLFKQWFIDFEFPNENGEPYKSSGGQMVDSELGEIPEGWEIKRLKQILNIKRGGSPRPIHDYIASSGLPWVKISDATALNNPFLFSTKEFIKVEGLRKTILLKKGSLILSNSATPGLPKFLELDACIHDGWLHFQDIECVTYNFLYLLFLYIRVDLVGQGNGSIFINLKTDILKEYGISIPKLDVMEKFSEVINPIFETIKNNASENIKLTNFRDTLLPKLISGELEINEISK